MFERMLCSHSLCKTLGGVTSNDNHRLSYLDVLRSSIILSLQHMTALSRYHSFCDALRSSRILSLLYAGTLPQHIQDALITKKICKLSWKTALFQKGVGTAMKYIWKKERKAHGIAHTRIVSSLLLMLQTESCRSLRCKVSVHLNKEPMDRKTGKE